MLAGPRLGCLLFRFGSSFWLWAFISEPHCLLQGCMVMLSLEQCGSPGSASLCHCSFFSTLCAGRFGCLSCWPFAKFSWVLKFSILQNQYLSCQNIAPIQFLLLVGTKFPETTFCLCTGAQCGGVNSMPCMGAIYVNSCARCHLAQVRSRDTRCETTKENNRAHWRCAVFQIIDALRVSRRTTRPLLSGTCNVRAFSQYQ